MRCLPIIGRIGWISCHIKTWRYFNKMYHKLTIKKG